MFPASLKLFSEFSSGLIPKALISITKLCALVILLSEPKFPSPNPFVIPLADTKVTALLYHEFSATSLKSTLLYPIAYVEE
ncbi:hypothetical protein D3C76_1601430 [compost metagenome]